MQKTKINARQAPARSSSPLKLLLALLVLGATFLISERTYAAGPSIPDTSVSGIQNEFSNTFQFGHYGAYIINGDNCSSGSYSIFGFKGLTVIPTSPYTILQSGSTAIPDTEIVDFNAMKAYYSNQYEAFSFLINCVDNTNNLNHYSYLFYDASSTDPIQVISATNTGMKIDFTQLIIVFGFWTAIICYVIILWLFRKKI